jgi:hypothetical protein
MGFLSALRGNREDAIRQSTSLTMVYLLEQNRKFEVYMRQKVAATEAQVAGQQARLEQAHLEQSPPPVEEEADDFVLDEPAEATDPGVEFSDLAAEAVDGPEVEEPEVEEEVPPAMDAPPARPMSVTAEEWTSLWGLGGAGTPGTLEDELAAAPASAGPGVAADDVPGSPEEEPAGPAVQLAEGEVVAIASVGDGPDVTLPADDMLEIPVEEPAAATPMPGGWPGASTPPEDASAAAAVDDGLAEEEADDEGDDVFDLPPWLTGSVVQSPRPAAPRAEPPPVRRDQPTARPAPGEGEEDDAGDGRWEPHLSNAGGPVEEYA